jgi:hypothetical protein
MSTETTNVELTSRHQLIDLNKKLVNFKLDFNVQSLENKDFDAVVMCQSEINNYDKLENIEMKNAPGKIGGTIIADNNKYENYFIILKSKEPQKVDITTTVEEIEPKEIESPVVDLEESGENISEKPFYRNRGFWVLVLMVVVLIGFYFKDVIGNLLQKNKTVEVVQVAPSIPEKITTGIDPVSDLINQGLSQVE